MAIRDLICDEPGFGKCRAARDAHKAEIHGDTWGLAQSCRDELLQGIEDHRERYRPRNGYERSIIDLIARTAVRFHQLARVVEERTVHRVNAAYKRHDDARDDMVVGLVRRLDTEPAEAIRQLLRTSEGCDFVADSWDWIREAIEARGMLGRAEFRRFHRLLGLVQPPDESADSDLRAACEAARIALDPAVAAEAGVPVESDPDVLQTARDLIVDLAVGRRDLYRSRGRRIWERFDRLERDMAPTLELAERSADDRQLVRDMATYDRYRRRFIAELEDYRRKFPDGVPDHRGDDAPRPKATVATKAAITPKAMVATVTPASPSIPASRTAVTGSPISRNEPKPSPTDAPISRNEPDKVPPADPISRNEPRPAAIKAHAPPASPATSDPDPGPKLNRRQRRALKKRQR